MPKLHSLCASVLLCLLAVSVQGKRAPNLELKDLSGNKQKLDSLHGSIAVVSFWATWCTPCRDELPRLSKLAQEYTPTGVRFVAISIDGPKDRPKIGSYIAEQKLTMDIWVGGDTDMMARVGLGDIVPGTIIFDQQGEIIGRVMGEAREEDIRSRIEWLRNGRQGAAPEPLTKRY
jgi:thiol-disulfide isomerase/thioredoxin